MLTSHVDDAGPVRARLGPPTAVDKEQPSPPTPAIQQAAAQAPTAPTEAGHLIDLPTALRLAGADNPTIAQAEEAVRLRLAEQMQARAMLFPTLNGGTNLRMHRGAFLSGRGQVIGTSLQSLYYGFGADAKGSGTVAIPGIRLFGHVADALYAPQAAERRVAQSQFSAVGTRNSILMDVGVAYLELAGAQARLAALEQTLRELREVERLTAEFAANKQGRESDARRAQSERMLTEADAERRGEDVNVAAAELARLLDLDPSLKLRSAEQAPPLLDFADASAPLEALVEQAIVNHPEIAASSAEVDVQDVRVRQERARPWLPLIALGFSVGEFGGGSDTGATRLGDFASRTDLDILAVWSLQNLGAGNHAIQSRTRAQRDVAQSQRLRMIDLVRRQVAEAHSLLQARRQQMELARVRVETSERAYRQEIARARNLLARPIEVLASVNQLNTARQDYVRALVGYSQAQLQLQAALGGSPPP